MLLLVATLAIANVVWFTARAHSGGEDFRVELTSHTNEYEASSAWALPLFEPKASWWSLDGQPLRSLVPHLVDSDPEGLGPDEIGKYFEFRLRDGSGSNEVRRAFQILASQGICQVAVADYSAEQVGLWHAPIYRIKTVKLDSGAVIGCTNRFKF